MAFFCLFVCSLLRRRKGWSQIDPRGLLVSIGKRMLWGPVSGSWGFPDQMHRLLAGKSRSRGWCSQLLGKALPVSPWDPLSCCVFMGERVGRGGGWREEEALGSLPLSFKKVFIKFILAVLDLS